MDVADRKLTQDVLNLLREIREAIETYHVPRWVLTVMSEPLRMRHHLVTKCEENRRRARLHDCLASNCVQEGADGVGDVHAKGR